MHGSSDGICRHLLSRPTYDEATKSIGIASGFDHKKLASNLISNYNDISGLYLPSTTACSGYELWSQTFLIYKHCMKRRKITTTACFFLNTKHLTDIAIVSSNLDKKIAQRECFKHKLQPCKFYSQMAEDSVLYNLFFKYHKNGTYLELGALDGVTYSNTLFLQETLGWHGILIEPGPKFQDLRRNRGLNSNGGEKNILHNLAVCNKPGIVNFQYVSGIEAEGGLDKPIRSGTLKNHSVRCDTLGNIIKISGIRHIDLISLDVEGRELEVLKSMDWSVPCNVFVIERSKNNEEIEDLLVSHGYQYIQEQRGNAIWALRTFYPMKGKSNHDIKYKTLISKQNYTALRWTPKPLKDSVEIKSNYKHNDINLKFMHFVIVVVATCIVLVLCISKPVDAKIKKMTTRKKLSESTFTEKY